MTTNEKTTPKLTAAQRTLARLTAEAERLECRGAADFLEIGMVRAADDYLDQLEDDEAGSPRGKAIGKLRDRIAKFRLTPAGRAALKEASDGET